MYEQTTCTFYTCYNIYRYGMWRILTGRHRTLEFSLMEAGHTKFTPDWHFGLWKMKWRHSTAETLEEVSSTVYSLSRNGHNIPQLVNDGDKSVQFYDWSSYFDEYFKKLPSIRKYHHFKMSSESPGIVFVKEYADSVVETVNILKRGHAVFDSDALPSVITPKGLDPARQWYLYDEIRPYCKNVSDTLESCPKPTCPRPHVKCEEKRKCPRKLSSSES